MELFPRSLASSRRIGACALAMLSIQDRMPTWRFSMPPTMQIALEPAGLSKPCGLPEVGNHESFCIGFQYDAVVNRVWLVVVQSCANIAKLDYDNEKVPNHQVDALTNALCHGSPFCGVPSPASRRAKANFKATKKAVRYARISFSLAFY